jgi:hypothetical protein
MRSILSVLLLLCLTGCFAERPGPKNIEWKLSPLFKSGAHTMIGEEGRLGFIYDDSLLGKT